MLLGHPSPKPTIVCSNGSWISGLNLGPLKKAFRIENSKLQTTRRRLSEGEGIAIAKSLLLETNLEKLRGRYVNKAGIQKFCGTKGLKLSASNS